MIDKSPDTVGINPRILKEMAEQPCVPLNIIVNSSIKQIDTTKTVEIICPNYS